ncbi:hypothetical protein ACVW00_004309 [Marmoricola sp. URHA0025 HA25]
MRKIALVAAAALVPLIPAAPAYAADHVICVNNPVGVTCDQSFALLGPAVTAADGNGLDDTIVLAPGTYSDGPYNLKEIGHHETLTGSGQGTTFITLPAGPVQRYLAVAGATVSDLTVQMNWTMSQSDEGIGATDSTLSDVTVDGVDTDSATGVLLVGSSLTDSTVAMTRAAAANTQGIFQNGNGTVTDTAITASIAYTHSIPDTTATLSRLLVRGSSGGIWTTAGSVIVDDTLIDLGTSPEGTGLAAFNDNYSSSPKSITADHVTIIGGGNFSVGVAAYARAPGALQQASVQLTNSIVAGPKTSFDVQATNDGLQGANSTASITTSYSDWSTQSVSSGPNGAATLTNGAGHLAVDPGFRNAAGGDYGLAESSPVIDKGAPGSGGPALDLSKSARILDGNGDGVAVRDMGAYEAPTKVMVPGTVTPDTTAPDTALSAHPKKRITKRRAVFGFTSNQSQVTFQCRLDKKAWASCTSPRSYRVTRGWHVFKVRARDAAGNLDPTPASWRFKRV